MNSKIKSVHARQIVDCKCRPMVEVDVVTEDGFLGRGCAPTGSSVGMFESCVLRDNDPAEYHGLSVHKAVDNVNTILAPALIGKDVSHQEELDQIMIDLDGTPEKKNLGGNAIYSTSIALFRAAAEASHQTLYEYIAGGNIQTVPVPSFNVINGGHYENLTQPFNEFIIMPYGASSIYESVEMGINTFQELEKVLTKYLGHKPVVAPSYGYASPSEDPEVNLNLMSEAIENCGYTGKIGFAFDCASSEMYDRETNTYLLKGERVSADVLIDYVKGLTEKFNFVFIEDLLDEEDWESYPKAHKIITRTNLLGDDFIVTNLNRLKRAYDLDALDGFILKPNQVGTITEALHTYEFAKAHQLIATPSGRAGGVIGDVVMDLAVGLQVGFIKNGAPRSGERIDKLNFLMRACDLAPNCKLADITPLLKF
ncbi:phosphopyruvate hydratase [Faecalicatena acetigenes]|jgi:enolase|uniref:Enolase n=1 Tax=Faecalicatena acetigenes TaxID=2981790 RepID=A0ABT2T838_9FIRM|nr:MULTISPECIES: phosphopyruvate hydratase [Lachnospiraceae]MCU6746433.1 phosphopyruvate hydratase [Faecalicatena acetigenes]SCH17934.1 Enolase [uncultured Clostridium sp.]